ncbi:MAG: hypothetical protein L3J81_05860, partial [Thermoplasmata archaeon]|nr:hypothetical protein [Thermoplasmata archaeon]
MAAPRAPPHRHSPLRAIWLTTGGVFLLTLLMAMPNVTAAGVRHSVTLAAPFHGTHHYASTAQSTGCGGSATIVVPPAFNLSTGIGREDGQSSANGCGPPTFSDTGFTEVTTGYDSLPFVAHAADRNFSFSFRSN